MTAQASVAAGTQLMVSTFRHQEELPVEITSSASIDRGASAMIFKGTLKFPDTTPITVALKVFPILLREHEQEMLRRELRTMSKVSHNCVLPFIGTASLGGRTIIVSPFMKNGNLLTYVRANPGVDRRLLIKQVAEAVYFLHVYARVIHGDLKCENVLVSNGGNALVTDFGLSSLIDKEESSATTISSIRNCNTLRFAAPELLLGPDDRDPQSPTGARGPRSKTSESDVYAFATLMLQAFTGKMPWPNLRNEAVLLKIASGEKQARPEGDALRLGLCDAWWEMCLKCWSFDPRDRPTMFQVWNHLEEIGASLSSFDFATTLPRNSPLPVTNILDSPYATPSIRGPDSTVYATPKLTGAVVCVAYESSSTSGLIIYATDDHWIHVVDATTRLSLGVAPFRHGGPVYALCLRPFTRQFFSCSEDGEIMEWTASSAVSGHTRIKGRGMRPRHSDAVTCLAHSPSREMLASGSLDCSIRLWDSETAFTIGSPLKSDTGVLCLAFSLENSKWLASGARDGTIWLWDVSTGCAVARIGGFMTSPLCSIAFVGAGDHLIAVTWPRQSVYVWRTTGEFLEEWALDGGSRCSIAISRNGQLIASHVPGGGGLKIRSSLSGRIVREHTCANESANLALAFSSDDRYLVVGYCARSALKLEVFDAVRARWGPIVESSNGLP